MMIANGTQASGGIGRNSSKTGKTYSLNFSDHPKKSPSGTPVAVASRKAIETRRQLTQMC
jgi:hypothetical protein